MRNYRLGHCFQNHNLIKATFDVKNSLNTIYIIVFFIFQKVNWPFTCNVMYFNDLRSSALFDNSKLSGCFFYSYINLPFIYTNSISLVVLISRKVIELTAWLSGFKEIYYLKVTGIELPMHRYNLFSLLWSQFVYLIYSSIHCGQNAIISSNA